MEITKEMLDLAAANANHEQIRIMYDAMKAERDALAAQVKELKERNRKLDVDLLRALFYAPSSPVSPDKAYEIEAWYGKFKQVHLASKEGES